MAVDGGYGPKGYPKFDPLGSPELNVDDEAVGQYAALVGNRKVGTAAQRVALVSDTTAANQAWVGLEFYDTDTGTTWICTSTSPITWRPTRFGGVFGGVTDTAGLITINHTLGVAPREVQATMHFLAGADNVPLLLEPVVWVRNATQVRLRFKRTSGGSIDWETSAQPLAVSMTAWP